MGFLFFVLGLSSVYALVLENFRVTATDGNTTTAVAACFAANLCDPSSGCCSGRGVCAYNATSASATCVCDTAAECIGTTSAYSGNICQTYSSGDCCTSASGTLAFSLNGGCHADSQFVSGTTVDPQRGARGQLLKRLGSANYADGFSTFQSWSKTIDQQFADLNSSSRTITLTRGNMLGLGFLEFAVKDVVHYFYNTSCTKTFDGVAYPTILPQLNTGANISGHVIPKQFANNASGAVDLDPLFNWAHRKPLPGNPSYLTPYIDITDALAYWNNTHHMSFEFLVALRYYARYHYYAVRSYEEFLCGQNSQSAAITNTCPIATLFGSLQQLEDWIYEQARRSTIRFSHALLQQSVLQILSDHPAGTDNTAIQTYSATAKDFDGYTESAWYFWFTRDTYPHSGTNWGSVRTHQEWSGDQTGANFTHFIQTGLDYLISMRNPTYDTAAWALASQDTCGITVSTNVLLKDVMTLAHTHLQRFGGPIASQYSADAKIQIYRSYELGLGSYNTHVGYLTNQPVTGLSTDDAFYHGAQVETNSARQYYATLPSVVLASLVGISNVLVADFGGYWHRNSSITWLLADTTTDGFTGSQWHPEHITPSRATGYMSYPTAPDFTYCYGGSATCSSTETTASNAGLALLGYSFEIDALDVDDSAGGMEDTYLWRSGGLTFTAPTLETEGSFEWASQNHIWAPSLSSDPASTNDHEVRTIEMFRLQPEFLNPLFWQFDGLNTYAAKQNSGHTRYLPNQLVDSIPLNIGWIEPYYDSYTYAGSGGTGPKFGCFDASVMIPTCTRYNGKVDYSAFGTSICTWQESFLWP